MAEGAQLIHLIKKYKLLSHLLAGGLAGGELRPPPRGRGSAAGPSDQITVIIEQVQPKCVPFVAKG